MGRQSEKDLVGVWRERITLANKAYDRWAERFKVVELYRWYEGYQGVDAYQFGDFNKDRYIINLIHPTIQLKIPSIFFSNPRAQVIPRAPREDDISTDIDYRAQLRADTLNTQMDDPRQHFKHHTTQALKESFFRMGIVEVGFGRDYIENPNAGKPILDDKGGKMMDPDRADRALVEPSEVPNPDNPDPETLFLKRIPACQFRVSSRAEALLSGCDWSGYFEWHYRSDLRKNPNYRSIALKSQGKLDAKYGGSDDTAASDDSNGAEYADDAGRVKAGMVKVWFIWDHRAQERFVLPDDGDKFLMMPQPYAVYPFNDLCWDRPLDGYYPIPPCFNWMSLQAEYNEIRQARKVHRKRYPRRYQAQKGMVDVEEKDKLVTGDDGTLIEVNTGGEVITPIQDASLDPQLAHHEESTKSDFREVTAVGGDQRGIAESETATQANLIESNLRVRDNYAQDTMADFLAGILYTMMQTIEHHFTLDMVIKTNVDPQSKSAPQEAEAVAAIWKEIEMQDIGDLSYDVKVDVENLSPVNEDTERQKLMAILGLFQQPTTMLGLSLSPTLMRKVMQSLGVRNSTEVAEIRQVFQALVMAQQGQAASGAEGEGAGPGGPDNQGKADGNAEGSPDAEIESQLEGQVGGVQ